MTHDHTEHLDKPSRTRYCTGCNSFQLHKPDVRVDQPVWECAMCGQCHHDHRDRVGE